MTRPAFTTIDGWCQLSGMGRTATYEAMQRGELPAHRVSKRKCLIDVERALEWLRSRPPAKVVEESAPPLSPK